MSIEDLELSGIIAFDGLTKNGLKLHPDQRHLVYPMGNKVSVKNIRSGQQTFLSGHTNLISAMCISPCGRYIASGQINHSGFKAMVILWDYEAKKLRSSYEIHKVRVEDLCFSSQSNYLMSLGGRDDGNPLCGTFASTEIAGNAYTISRANLRDRCFATGGDGTLKVWRIDPDARKVLCTDVKMGKLRRCINCLAVDQRDEEVYCGTTSGDVIRAKLNFHHNVEYAEPVQPPVMIGCYSKLSKCAKNRKNGLGDLYAGGVSNLLLCNDGRLIVGSGNGAVELVEVLPEPGKINKKLKSPSTPQLKTILAESVRSGVTSLLLVKETDIIVGTQLSEIYQIKLKDFDMRLLVTCHTATIYDVVFPHNYSEIFATGSKNDIRLWRLDTRRELLRISVPNFVCTSIFFSYDGRMLISAWNDGIIRAFTPQSGRLIFAILNAHFKAVSAITFCIFIFCKTGANLGNTSGETEARLRPQGAQRIRHQPTHQEGNQVISSSTDGTCIVWDINRCVRKQVLIGNTMYMAACFSPNGVQILTCGTDRKITYWETLDGSMIRELEGSGSAALNTIDVSPDGEYFVTGGNDSVVKLWHYHNGEITHIGMGHAAIVTAARFSPDGKHIITVSGDGAIMIWKCPFPMKKPPEPSTARSLASSRSTCSLRENMIKSSLNLDLGNENVAELTPRSEVAESVKAVRR
ncbi:unnamed protein product [Trichogramma brassicae]|uniref:Cilia- and flagella-associated protein 52 n=1 Tax=Trichogramma brassicae TaxID=86971 RepID=A0A6H5IBE4_9HYME|nr:unnamed protein product [Trichogramma brassicae]